MLRPELLLISAMVLNAVAIFFLAHFLLSRRKDQELLLWASGEEPPKSRSPLVNLLRPLVHQFALKYVPYLKTAPRVEKIKKLLVTSGLAGELNEDEFMGFQIFWGVGLPLVLVIFNFLYDLELPYLFLLLAAPLGWRFPEIFAQSEKQKRQTQIRAELPFMADILALSTEAGLDFIAALQKIVDKARDSELAKEFGVVLKDIKLGATRAAALRSMADRCDMMEITSFIAVLVDADQTGASIAKVLKDQSNQIRLERFVRAEKLGARASQLIMFPILVFIVPAVFLVIFGPIAITFLTGGK